MLSLAPYAALVAVAGFGLVAPSLSRVARPALATWLLSVGSVISAASTLTVLTLMSLPLIGRDDALMDYANVSVRLLDKDTGSGIVVAAAALGTQLVLLVRFCRQLRLQLKSRAEAAHLLRSTGAVPGQLLVLPDDHVDVYALAARGGVIVATRGLVRCLSPEQRRAVLAHEHAHLRYHHHRHLSLLALAECLNPLLWRLPATGAFAIERWADEVSAASSSRATTAGALSAVAERESERTMDRFRARLAAVSLAVASRIAALQAGAPSVQPVRIALIAALPVFALVAAGITAGRVLDAVSIGLATAGRALPHH